MRYIIHNEVIKKQLMVKPIMDKVLEGELWLLGRVSRMPKERNSKVFETKNTVKQTKEDDQGERG